MADQTNRTVWWICDRCNAQVAISAIVYSPLDTTIIRSRAAMYGGQNGELWATSLLVGSDGLSMKKPNYCPCCGAEVVS